MRRSVQLNVMRRLGRVIAEPDAELAPRTTELDVARYVDEGQLSAELDGMFRRTPLAVAHASEVDEVGRFVTLDVAGTPLVIVRADDGIRVLVNACRHRGARLTTEPTGHCKAFTCPYHAWSYRLDGELFHVPALECFDGLDPAQRPLHSVPHEVRHGFVWVGLGRDEAPGVADFLGEVVDDDLAAFGLDTHHVGARSDRTIAANWKLVMDAFAEGYHLKSLHRQTLSRFFLESAVLDDCTPHVRQVGARKSLVEHLQSPEDTWDLRRDTTVFYNLFPNSILVFHPHWVSWLSLLPVAVDRVRVVHRALVPADAPDDEASRARFDKSFVHIDRGVFEAEDLMIAQNIQSTLRDPGRRDETMVLGAREEGMRLFHAARDAALRDGDG